MTEYEITPPPTRSADRVQLRSAFTTERGELVRFMTQLEYWLDGDWCEVVRYDHDRDAEGGHNVESEGLHRDIYRDGEKHRTEKVTGPLQAKEGFEYAEEDLHEGVERYIRRFERWHGVKDTTDL